MSLSLVLLAAGKDMFFVKQLCTGWWAGGENMYERWFIPTPHLGTCLLLLPVWKALITSNKSHITTALGICSTLWNDCICIVNTSIYFQLGLEYSLSYRLHKNCTVDLCLQLTYLLLRFYSYRFSQCRKYKRQTHRNHSCIACTALQV